MSSQKCLLESVLIFRTLSKVESLPVLLCNITQSTKLFKYKNKKEYTERLARKPKFLISLILKKFANACIEKEIDKQNK